ncbi:MAG: DUF1080 domain-containing protein [Planctomycetes bacterium]|nr:DUF1080 domain-containing protein [Planctomycetota bacterium]
MRRLLPAALALLLAACQSPPPPAAWRELFDGATLTGWTPTNFGGEGEVAVRDGAIELDYGSPLTGVTLLGEPPRGDYDLELVCARVEGTDFFCGLTFPVHGAHLTLVLGGWGGSLCGLSNLDGDDAARNETRTLRGFENGRDYRVLVRVRRATVAVLIDDEPLLRADLDGRELSLRPEVELCRPLGFAAFSTRARLRALRWRPAR